MGLFSRLTDIINSNINAILDRAEDPEKLIGLIIQEMEDTLVEVRSSAVKTIAEKKDLTRSRDRLQAEARSWAEKAELALSKNRDDLARAALLAKKRALAEVERLTAQLAEIDTVLENQQDDIGKLQAKLDDAKARRQALVARAETAQNRLRMREHVYGERVNGAIDRFDRVEQQLDELEGRVEAVALGRGKSLSEEFEALEAEAGVEDELATLKAKLSGASAATGTSSASGADSQGGGAA